MRKIKMLALAMGLAFVASQGNQAAALGQCEAQCYKNDRQCQIICSQNPCLISCEDQLRYCLAGC
jgi:hypothetical protein